MRQTDVHMVRCVMSDLIKREDAIEAMEQRYDDILRTFKRKVKVGEKAIVMDMIGCVKALSSADRPQGEWIDDGGIEKCNQCGERKEFPHWNFCPNCGARMKGVDDETIRTEDI